MTPDLECTWWPDKWFGYDIQEFCIKHDLGLSDEGMLMDLLEFLPWWLWPMPFVMYGGLKIFGPAYRAIQKYKRRR